jgi:hypothetical protein
MRVKLIEKRKFEEGRRKMEGRKEGDEAEGGLSRTAAQSLPWAGH